MRNILIGLSILMISACAVELKSKPIEVSGNVTHTITVDSNQLADLFNSYCSKYHTNQDELNECVADMTAMFWERFNQSANQGE